MKELCKLGTGMFIFILTPHLNAAVFPGCSQGVISTSFIRNEAFVSVVNEPYVVGATQVGAELFVDGDWWVGGIHQGNIQHDAFNSQSISVTGTPPNQVMNGSVSIGILTTRWGDYPLNTLGLTWDKLKADGWFYGLISGVWVHYPQYNVACEDVFSTE